MDLSYGSVGLLFKSLGRNDIRYSVRSILALELQPIGKEPSSYGYRRRKVLS
jgi:hypothetical protein